MKFKMPVDKEVEVSQEEWESYLEVQKSGEFNMIDPNARLTAGVDKLVWLAILSNYSALEQKYGGR